MTENLEQKTEKKYSPEEDRLAERYAKKIKSILSEYGPDEVGLPNNKTVCMALAPWYFNNSNYFPDELLPLIKEKVGNWNITIGDTKYDNEQIHWYKLALTPDTPEEPINYAALPTPTPEDEARAQKYIEYFINQLTEKGIDVEKPEGTHTFRLTPHRFDGYYALLDMYLQNTQGLMPAQLPIIAKAFDKWEVSPRLAIIDFDNYFHYAFTFKPKEGYVVEKKVRSDEDLLRAVQ
jgi:hypothetical protein